VSAGLVHVMGRGARLAGQRVRTTSSLLRLSRPVASTSGPSPRATLRAPAVTAGGREALKMDSSLKRIVSRPDRRRWWRGEHEDSASGAPGVRRRRSTVFRPPREKLI
jgi:hypothetical protein